MVGRSKWWVEVIGFIVRLSLQRGKFNPNSREQWDWVFAGQGVSAPPNIRGQSRAWFCTVACSA